MIQKILIFIALVLVAVIAAGSIGGMVQGCAALVAPVAEKVAIAVERYCEEPLSYRQIYRNTVNSELTATGHVVHVHCSGDPPTTP
jgi:hypothetical protein